MYIVNSDFFPLNMSYSVYVSTYFCSPFKTPPFFNASLSFGTHGGLDYQREQTTRVFSAPAKQKHYSKMFSEEFDIYCFKKYPGSHHEEESRLLLDFLILIFLVGYSNLISIWRNTIFFSVLRTAEGLNFYL